MTAGEPFAPPYCEGLTRKESMGINALESHPIPPLAPNTINPYSRRREEQAASNNQPTKHRHRPDGQRQLRRVKQWVF